MIRLENISKIYSKDVVLKNINWDIKKGEKIGLVGSNGAGKTTQLNILIGLEEQTSGSIIREGNPKISYLTQEFDLKIRRTVRQELESAFIEVELISQKLKDLEIEMSNTSDMAKLDFLVRELGVFQSQFESLGGYQIQADVEKILVKLGFSNENADEFVENFSGGWQMKIALGKIMLQKPDLLLLDEPTNHLDLDTISWLEEYLLPHKVSMILISHDRYFLDKLCNKIVFIENGYATTYKGNYSFFIGQKLLDDEAQNKAYLLQQKEIHNQTKYIERFRASAKRSTQAKSREKQLNKIVKIQNPVSNIKSPLFNFPYCRPSSKSVLEIKNLSHGYGDNLIFFEADLEISYGEKVAFIGPNGCGKSTLFKLIMQKLDPELGEIKLGKTNLIKSFYEQNQSEALPLDQLVIDLIFKQEPSWTQQRVRTFLGSFGFYKESVFKKVENLSGGEKARLALALMIIKPSNFLLLDEPTNHLDLPSKENLEYAINRYKGTVLFISHDRYFISKVANKVIEISNYQLNQFNGNYEYYLEKRKNK